MTKQIYKISQFSIKGAMIVILLLNSSVFANELDKKLQNFKSFEADFVQETFNDKGKKINFAKGQIKLKRPNRIYWKSTEPDLVQITSNGNTLFNYDIELEQITKQPISSALSSSPALLIISGQPIAKDYFIKVLSQKECLIGKTCFEIKPKLDNPFQSMQVGFGAKDELMYFKVKDNLATTTQVKFINSKLNLPMSESWFDFQIPKGVDVMDGKG